MLRAGLRRIAIIAVAVLGGTALISVVLGALAHSSLQHAVAIGFYLVAVMLFIGSFVFGIRGPLQAEYPDEEEIPSGAMPTGQMPRMLRRRRVRRSTWDERKETRRVSIMLFVCGLAVVLLASAIDPTKRAF